MVWQTSQTAGTNVGWRAEKQVLWYHEFPSGQTARDFQLRITNHTTT